MNDRFAHLIVAHAHRDPLEAAVEHGFTDCVDLMFRKAPDIYHPQRRFASKNLLMIACQFGRTDLARYIIGTMTRKRGGGPKLYDYILERGEGRTALQYTVLPPHETQDVATFDLLMDTLRNCRRGFVIDETLRSIRHCMLGGRLALAAYLIDTYPRCVAVGRDYILGTYRHVIEQNEALDFAIANIARGKRNLLARLNPDGNDCSVCLEPLDGLVQMMASPKDMEDARIEVLECGHRFHGGCLARVILEFGSCPLCRAPISEALSSLIYFNKLN